MSLPINKNQEAKADAGKLPLSLVPKKVIEAIAKIRVYGTKKYKDPDNWKKVEPIDRYWDATLRHIYAAWDDWKAIDPESGYPHIYHAATNLAFLIEFMNENKEEQDGK